MALKTVLDLGAEIIILQELFIGNQELVHSTFNFYQPQGTKTVNRVMTAVKKDLLDKIVVEHRTELVNHLYITLLKIQNVDQ